MENKHISRPYSEQRRTAVYWLIVEFHALATQWLAAIRHRRTLPGRIYRAGTRAAIAVQLASTGRHTAQRLSRAQEAMIECLSAFELLRSEGRVAGDVADVARRRIDQILSGIDQLERTPVGEWAELKPPPLASKSTDVALQAWDGLAAAALGLLVHEGGDAVDATAAGPMSPPAVKGVLPT